jgi:hypothetical protein
VLLSHARAPDGELLVVERGSGGAAQARRWLVEHDLPALPVVTVASLPVDPRHESKIDRAQLRSRRGRR